MSYEYDEEPQDTDEHTSEVIVPSNPADRKKLRGMLEEIVAVLQKNEDNRLSIKVIKDEIKKQFNLSPKYSGALAKTMHKQNYDEVRATQTDFEFLYDAVVRKQPAPVAQFGEEEVRASFSEAALRGVLADLESDESDTDVKSDE